MPSNTTRHLPMLPSLSTKSRHAAVLLQLKSTSLISLGELCDNDFKTELTKKDLKVCKNNKLILLRTRNKFDRLWDILIKSQLQHYNYIRPPLQGNLYKSNYSVKHNHFSPFLDSLSHLVDSTLSTLNKYSTKVGLPKISQFMAALNPLIDQNTFDSITHSNTKINNKAIVIIRKKQIKKELAQCLHAACMSQTPSTFLRAIKNNHFVSWPGLTVDLIILLLSEKGL